MQLLGLRSTPVRTLASPEGLTERQRLEYLVSEECSSVPPQPMIGCAYISASLAVPLLSIFIQGMLSLSTVQMGAFNLLLLIPRICVFTWLFGRGLRALSPDARTAVLKAQKFPILYLRPFDTDDETIPYVPPVLQLFYRTPEQQRIRPFRRRLDCPVVAIGRPGEEEGSFGALRLWVQHDVWQEKVRQLAQDAPLVLLFLGDTKGSMWEVKEVASRLPPERVIILLPNGFRERIQSILDRFLPVPPGPIERSTRVISFSANWNATQSKSLQAVLSNLHTMPRIDPERPYDPRQRAAETSVWGGCDLPEWKRLLFSFAAPLRTFRDIARGNERWWPALALSLLCAGTASFFIVRTRGGAISPDEGSFGSFASGASVSVFDVFMIVWMVGAAVLLPIAAGVLAAAIFASVCNRLFKGEACTRRVFTVLCYAGMPLAGCSAVLALFFPRVSLGGQPITAIRILALLVLVSLGLGVVARVRLWKGFIVVFGTAVVAASTVVLLGKLSSVN